MTIKFKPTVKLNQQLRLVTGFDIPNESLTHRTRQRRVSQRRKLGAINARLVLSQDIKKRSIFFPTVFYFFIGLKPAKVTKGRGSKSDKGRKKTMTRFVFFYGCLYSLVSGHLATKPSCCQRNCHQEI